MRVAWDAKALNLSHSTGRGRYALSIIPEILRLRAHDTADKFFLFWTDEAQLPHDFPPSVQVIHNLRFIRSGLLRSLLLPYLLRKYRVDLFHGMMGNVATPFLGRTAKYVVTMHDLLSAMFPDLFTLRVRTVTRLTLSRVIRRADAIIAVSETTKHDIQRLFGVPGQKVCVIYEAPSRWFKPLPTCRIEATTQRYALSGPYLLFVGLVEPRKNLDTLLLAYALLKSRRKTRGHRLVVAGRMGWYYKRYYRHLSHSIRNLGLEQDVVFTGFVPDEDLAALYNGATTFIFPSSYEGFGLPILEAMACGTPVITSNVSALPEVAGDAACLIEPRNPEQLAAAIEAVLSDPHLQRRLREGGLARAHAFSWEETAAKTLQVYEALRP